MVYYLQDKIFYNMCKMIKLYRHLWTRKITVLNKINRRTR